MSTDNRTDVLRRAVTVMAEFDQAVVDDVFTEDITVSSPGITVSSRTALSDELRDRDETFSDLAIDLKSCGVVDEHGYAEWTATATLSAPLVVDGETLVDATGERITLHGASVADFTDDRISALRQYWDEGALLEALGILPPDD